MESILEAITVGVTTRGGRIYTPELHKFTSGKFVIASQQGGVRAYCALFGHGNSLNIDAITDQELLNYFCRGGTPLGGGELYLNDPQQEIKGQIMGRSIPYGIAPRGLIAQVLPHLDNPLLNLMYVPGTERGIKTRQWYAANKALWQPTTQQQNIKNKIQSAVPSALPLLH